MLKTVQPSIFVVVLNYNGKDTLTACLSSVFQSDFKGFEVVVVDNNSIDGSFELAKNQFPRAHFIKNSKNIGFAKGNNIGIRFALEKFADYILVLNNDAYLEKNTILELAIVAEKTKTAGIFNPIILNANNNSIWFAGGKIDWLKMKNQHLTKISSQNPYSTQYCTGCAMFINKEVFKKIGLFDERYFLYYEDADFSVRARNAGFDLRICPSAKVLHIEQSSINNPLKTYWLVLSGMIFFFSQGSPFQKIWLLFYLQLRKFKNYFLNLLKPSQQTFQVKKAYKDFRKINLL
ncbi:MAG: glycosyltransferase family 2 protein [Candidatus Moraniibacteriota bacterium]|jgi:GT2 family glycosyltransferase